MRIDSTLGWRLWGALVALSGCDTGPNHPGVGPTDMHVAMDADQAVIDAAPPPMPLFEGQLHGQVTDQAAEMPLADVTVTLRCGATEQTVQTHDNGRFGIDVEPMGCDAVLTEVALDGYALAARGVPVPLPSAQVWVRFALTPLDPLDCSGETCRAALTPGARFPSTAVQGGGVRRFNDARDFGSLPGSLQTIDGAPFRVLTAGYFALEDQAGAALAAVDLPVCTQIGTPTRSQIGDLTPNAGDDVVLQALRYDAAVGRWRRVSGGFLGVGFAGGIEPADEADLAAARSGDLLESLWACGHLDSPGWLAWGIVFPATQCVQVTARTPSGQLAAGIVVRLTGVDDNLLVRGWTDHTGRLCLVTPTAEPAQSDLDGDGEPGEALTVDVSTVGGRFTGVAIPATAARCDAPEACVQLEHELPSGN